MALAPKGVPQAPGQIEETITTAKDLSKPYNPGWYYEYLGHYLDQSQVRDYYNYGGGALAPQSTKPRLPTLEIGTYDPRSLPPAANDPADIIEPAKYVGEKVLARVLSKFVPFLNVISTLKDVYDLGSWLYSYLANRAIEQQETAISEGLDNLFDRDTGRFRIEVSNVPKDQTRIMEEVVVTGYRTSSSAGSTIDFRDFKSLVEFSRAGVVNPTPFVAPRYKPEIDINPNIDLLPARVPRPQPDLDWGLLPDSSFQFDVYKMPNGLPGVSFRTKVNTGTQIRINEATAPRPVQRLRPRRSHEENKLRKDRKTKEASRIIRATYAVVTATYGVYSEVKDLAEVIAWNVYIDGKPLAQYSDINAALQKALTNPASLVVDYQSLALDYAMMQFEDYMIGYVMSYYGRQASETGWVIQNPYLYGHPPGG